MAGIVTAVALALPLLSVAAFPASAQGDSCSGSGVPASVEIDEPGPRVPVSDTVVVRGSARVTLTALGGQLDRVEASVGRLSKSRDYDPDSSLDFEFEFDVSELPFGDAQVRVVACGPSSRGEDSVTVLIRNSPTTTAAPRSTTTVASPAPTVGVGGAVSSGPSTSVAAPPSTVAGDGATSPSTTVETPPPTVALEPEVKRTEPSRPRSGSEFPLFLTESPGDRSPRPPLWVGAVVGISGGLGLAFSAISWRRRAAATLEPLEPVDNDLVEVG